MTEEAGGPQAAVDEILFDARSLQADPGACRRLADYDVALLRAVRHRDWPRARPRLVGLVDAAAPPLREHHRLLFDEVAPGRRRIGRRRRWFVSTSPTMREPVWASPILLDGAIAKIGVVHEQISPDRRRERLADLGQRADYLTALAWLGSYDLFIVGSAAVKADLERHRSTDPAKIVVGGRAIRDGLRTLPGEAALPFEGRRHIAAMVDGHGGEDLERVLEAHALSAARFRFPLVLIGRCAPDRRGSLRGIHARAGGAPGALRFVEDPDDRDLGALYREALLTVVPRAGHETLVSFAAESAALGTPAVVLDAGQPDDAPPAAVPDRSPADPGALSRILDAAAGGGAAWEEARAMALAGPVPATLEAAARRAVDAMDGHTRARMTAPAVVRGSPARLALVTPLPPARCGNALRSSALIEALSRHVEVHVFSDTPAATPGGGAKSLAPVRDLEGSVQPLDASLSVLGNSRRYASTFEYLRGNGGAALVHDAQLLGFYADTFGPERVLDLARAEQGGEVGRERIEGWLREPHDMPLLFLSEVAEAAAPLLVASEAARRAAADAYGIEPRRLPPLQHRTVDRERLAPEARRVLRQALGWRRDEVVLCAFGLGRASASVVVWALRLLRDWGLDARLTLGRTAGDPDGAETGRLARELDLHGRVASVPDDLPEAAYLDHLAAADVAVQVGGHRLSGPSETMMDYIAAALPTVADDHAGAAAEAPGFVCRVPDALSPVLVAEAALGIVSSERHRLRPVDEARDHAAAHAPAPFALAMAEALGLDGRRR